MITALHVQNFKKLEDIRVELGEVSIFIGPNNSGKTTALQALALWELGLRKWLERRGSDRSNAAIRSGVVINRKDVMTIPLPSARLLWSGKKVRRGNDGGAKGGTTHIPMAVGVEGISPGGLWSLTVEFSYTNEESFHVRVRDEGGNGLGETLEEARKIRTAYLPPLSGLSDQEFMKQPGEIDFLIGQGRTAEVLRNLCWRLFSDEEGGGRGRWEAVREQMLRLFGVQLQDPILNPERAELVLEYVELTGKGRKPGPLFDIACSGRGFQQVLLLLTYLSLNEQGILLLDEPDCHLEVLRQREVYGLLARLARERGCQIAAASHSAVILQAAGQEDVLVAFLGEPHRIDERSGRSRVLKSLRTYGYDHYVHARENGWVLYLEGSTDLSILKQFAETLQHLEAIEALRRPFVHEVANAPSKADEHFHALREGCSDLVGVALFDRLDKKPHSHPDLIKVMWTRREIENYLCREEVLLRYAEATGGERGLDAMRAVIGELSEAFRIARKGSLWSPELKASDDVLDVLFANYFERLGSPNLMRKTNYHVLAGYLEADEFDAEIKEKLDLIGATAQKAQSRR